MQGFRAEIKWKLDSAKRAALIDSVVRTWPEKDRLAFEDLWKAAWIFIHEQCIFEVNSMPVVGEVLVVEEEDDLNEEFKKTLFTADHCRLAPASAREFLRTDRRLNKMYMRIMKASTLREWGTLEKSGIREVQHKWTLYRNAWTAFGAIHCPQTTADAWKTRITNARIDQLRNFAEIAQ